MTNKTYYSIFSNVGTTTEVQEETILEIEEVELHTIVLYNDDVNTFDFVITTLVEVCEHDPVQAEQVAYIVHYKGKCDVKKGEYEVLEPICKELLRRGLSAKIH